MKFRSLLLLILFFAAFRAIGQNQLTWTIEANAEYDATTAKLTSTATVWNEFSGAHSNETLPAGTDGWAEFDDQRARQTYWNWLFKSDCGGCSICL